MSRDADTQMENTPREQASPPSSPPRKQWVQDSQGNWIANNARDLSNAAYPAPTNAPPSERQLLQNKWFSGAQGRGQHDCPICCCEFDNVEESPDTTPIPCESCRGYICVGCACKLYLGQGRDGQKNCALCRGKFGDF